MPHPAWNKNGGDKMKRCTKCLIEKAEIEFSQDKNNKDGLKLHCKQCAGEYSRIWAIKNKDKVAETNYLKFAENTQQVPNLRTIKICPACLDGDIYKRRNKRGFYCQTCKISFPIAATKQVADRRNSLGLPKHLKTYVNS
jgi:protein-arginine kinase activator protein McsA